MPQRQNRLIPIDWDPLAVRLLAEIAPDDVEAAKVWWEQYAPGLYEAIMDAFAVGDSETLTDETSARDWLQRNADSMDDSQKAWAAAGILFLFWGGRYYSVKGLPVPPKQIVGALSRTLGTSNFDTQAHCAKLQSGDISLKTWQMGMKDNIIASNIAAGSLAAGGVGGLTPSVTGLISSRIRFQLEKLNLFAGAISGGMRLDGRLCRLMKMYINSARGTYHGVDGLVKVARGFDEYRNILGAGEAHCTGGSSCPGVSDLGWRPVGTLTPIGSRTCMSNCLCSWEYRNSITGEAWN